MWEELTEKAEVLIVAKCNVNSKEFIESFLKKFVLIVAKCNVNSKLYKYLKDMELSINSSKV